MPRKIWVATTCFRALSEQPRTVEQNIRRAEELVDQAAAYQPDLICLPESFPSIRVPHQQVEEVAQEVPGPATETLARKARQHRAYVVCPLFERRGRRVYNVAVLLDRDGQIVGAYEKVHPVASRPPLEPGALLERGVTPGREPKVFETDFGKIGILICFDSNWPEEWATLKRKGAELVVFPSAYEAGLKLFAHAWNNKYYVVSSTWSTPSKIIDLTGQLIATTGTYTDLAVAQIDLEKRFFHLDWHAAKLAEIQRRYGRKVKVQWCLPEAGFTLESESDDLTVGQLIEEFELQPYEEYIAASTALQDRQRGS